MPYFIFLVFVSIVIPVVVVLAINIDIQIKIKHYKESAYYKVTHNEYKYMMSDKGRRGEYQLYRNLTSLENEGAKFLFNVYLPREKGTTTEIDMLMFYRGEIFVFENKNYGGWIFGKSTDLYWTQSYRAGRRTHKEKFYNPIMQNDTHIKYLHQIIGSNCQINSVIVFSDRATLKRIENYSSAIIAQTGFVMSYVKNKLYQPVIDNSERLYEMLYPYSQVTEDVKSNHINNIKNEQKNTTAQINRGIDIGIYSSGASIFNEPLPVNKIVNQTTEKESSINSKKKDNMIQTIAMVCAIIVVIGLSILLSSVYMRQRARIKNTDDAVNNVANNILNTENNKEEELDPFAYTYRNYLYRLIEIENEAREFVATCEKNNYDLSDEECDAYYEEFNGYIDEIDLMLEEFDEYRASTGEWYINERGVIDSYKQNVVYRVLFAIVNGRSRNGAISEVSCSNIIFATGSIHDQIEFIPYWGIRYRVEVIDGSVGIFSYVE